MAHRHGVVGIACRIYRDTPLPFDFEVVEAATNVSRELEEILEGRTIL